MLDYSWNRDNHEISREMTSSYDPERSAVDVDQHGGTADVFKSAQTPLKELFAQPSQ